MAFKVPIAVLLLSIFVACAPRVHRVDQTDWESVNVDDEKAYPLGRFGGLQHTLRIASSEGRTLRLRGKVHNPYPNSVAGVRIVVQILAASPPDDRELERHEIEFTEVNLASGAETAVGREIQTMYTTSKFIRVAAFAMKRDGADLPPPPADLGDLATVQLSVAGAPIPNSMAGNIFSGF